MKKIIIVLIVFLFFIELSYAQEDITAPILSSGLPSWLHEQNNNSTTISLISSENAICKYSIFPSTDFDDMEVQFTNTWNTNHSIDLWNLISGAEYKYYIRCSDVSSNHNIDDYEINFTISSPQTANSYISQNGVKMLKLNDMNDIRLHHPRISIKSEELDSIINRMYGVNAIEPYKTWFNTVKEIQDNGQDVSQITLALIYLATNNNIYKDKFIENIPENGKIVYHEMVWVDLMYNHLSNDIKKKYLERASSNEFHHGSHASSKWETKERWWYHAYNEGAVAFSAVFWYTDILNDPEVISDTEKYLNFDVNNYLKISMQTVSEDGYLRKIERRVWGDMSDNPALPGEYGGMYDNTAYDIWEESESIKTIATMSILMNDNQLPDYFLHDKYRAQFHHGLSVPHTYKYNEHNAFCKKTGGESYRTLSVWNTATDYLTQPSNLHLLNYIYKDPKINYYIQKWKQEEKCGNNIMADRLVEKLLYHDSNQNIAAPNTTPKSMYFSGPGIVTMRSNWDKDSTFWAFISGDSFSRRYEDGNSFIIHKDQFTIPHAWSRIRYNAINLRHHWYTLRSAAKNTLKIFDPNETIDFDNQANELEHYSGEKIEDKNNLWGQLFHEYRGGGPTSSGIDSWDIKKYEHIEDQYTYTQWDATQAYSKKIDFFERDFLFLNEDIFIIFDKVKSIDPSFKKVWTMHTVDQPKTINNIETQNFWNITSINSTWSIIETPTVNTYIDTLLPKKNKIIIRGWDTIIAQSPLNNETDIIETQIAELDTARWLEIFAIWSDTVGKILIEWETSDSINDNEELEFDGTIKVWAWYAYPDDTMTENSLHIAWSKWKTDEWVWYYLKTKWNNSNNDKIIITWNNHDTLYADIPNVWDIWKFEVYKPVVNTSKYWKNITKISTIDMDVDNLVISVNHFFDAEDVTWTVQTFSPHTDAKSDQYTGKSAIWRYTFEVEATKPMKLDNFLNVISLKSSWESKAKTTLVEWDTTSAVLINNKLVIFGNTPDDITTTNLTLNYEGNIDILAFWFTPNTKYYYTIDGVNITISDQNNSLNTVNSSDMWSINLKNITLVLPEIIPEEDDITPAVIVNLTELWELEAGTSQVNISFNTNEIANCKYSNNSNQIFNSMEYHFTNSDWLSHSAQISWLEDDNNYIYYIKCRDLHGNDNPIDTQIIFSINSDEISVIDTPPIVEAPRKSWGGSSSSRKRKLERELAQKKLTTEKQDIIQDRIKKFKANYPKYSEKYNTIFQSKNILDSEKETILNNLDAIFYKDISKHAVIQTDNIKMNKVFNRLVEIFISKNLWEAYNIQMIDDINNLIISHHIMKVSEIWKESQMIVKNVLKKSLVSIKSNYSIAKKSKSIVIQTQNITKVKKIIKSSDYYKKQKQIILSKYRKK